ncbi:transcription factor IIA, alpha/beta subunit [Parathielavia hyrcaniae]|uniref:Transcription initiation factor IIA large subunit n=1 Tax=Parathielavia hyrcaniae TaxID=113614 RepID=A0AAN6T6D7_9PEZI|nr:transcription factor IIA, alpha/beta subunit [Parathielavia hyrcaniae]
MSNTAVGTVYDTIISEVINAVHVDFEENGVDDGALEDLKKTWQHKLSQMKVAQFPWDPKPEPMAQSAPAPTPTPAPTTAPPAAAPPNAPAATTAYTQSTLSPQSSAQSLSLPATLLPNSNAMAVKPEPAFAQVEPGIKQEPGLPPVHQGYNPTNGARPTAAQRAALALENQYGQRAAASINAIHSGIASQPPNPTAQAQQVPRQGQVPQHMNPQHMNPQHMNSQHMNPQHMNPQHMNSQHMNPQHMNQQHMNHQQQYRQGVAAAIQQQMQQQMPRPRPPNGLPAAQLDGSADTLEGGSSQAISDSNEPAVMSRAQIDEHLHAQLAARAKQMEGGGLMLPLKKAAKGRGAVAKRQSADGPAQFDGLDDDIKSEEDDEDAINSDLDDPDDVGEDDEDDDETMGHMMLCMYDKVQRVKNKWKCILKDGVLTVNGKEYVFHKATGEYEW